MCVTGGIFAFVATEKIHNTRSSKDWTYWNLVNSSTVTNHKTGFSIAPLICIGLYVLEWPPFFHLLGKLFQPGDETVMWLYVLHVCERVGQAGFHLVKQTENLCLLYLDVFLQNALAWRTMAFWASELHLR